MRPRTDPFFSSKALTVFLGLVLMEGFHELEHIVRLCNTVFS
jgi:hypothetical protein